MKKYLSMILVVAIAAMLSVSAFAAPTDASVNVPGNQEIPVKLGILGDLGHRYSIELEYTSMTFTYSKDGMEWVIDEKGEYYYNMKDTGWTDADQTLVIYNHSDLKLGYTVTMEKATKYDDLTFTFTDASAEPGVLRACVAGDTYGDVNAEITIKVSGAVPHDAENNDPLGQLIVAFTPGS